MNLHNSVKILAFVDDTALVPIKTAKLGGVR